MKAAGIPAVYRKAVEDALKQGEKKLQKEKECIKKECAELALEQAKNWIETDGMKQMFLAVMKLVYYTLHVKRPGKGFDSKKGIVAFHNDLVSMMNENLEEYCFNSDDDAIFVCDYWLKEIGVEVDKLPSPITFKLNWS